MRLSREPNGEIDKMRAVIDQLDRADLYLVAAGEVGLEDRDLRAQLEELHRTLVGVRDLIIRPRVMK